MRMSRIVVGIVLIDVLLILFFVLSSQKKTQETTLAHVPPVDTQGPPSPSSPSIEHMQNTASNQDVAQPSMVQAPEPAPMPTLERAAPPDTAGSMTAHRADTGVSLRGAASATASERATTSHA